MEKSTNGTVADAVCALRSVEFGVTDLERSTEFYTAVWGLKPVGEYDGARYFRGAGPEHHFLTLRQSEIPGYLGAEFAVANATAVDALAAAAERHDGISAGTPGELDRPGGGYGVTLTDRGGREWRLSAGVREHVHAEHAPDRPYKASHVVLNSPDREADVAFATGVLGFRVRDVTRGMTFLGCNADHHSLAITGIKGNSVNHVAFEVESIDAVMRAAGRLKRHGYPMHWGIGRHGPGANVFSYYLDPDGLPIEFTAEVQQIVDGNYRPGTPADWDRPPFFDAWGYAEPPSERFRAASAGELVPS